MRRLWPGSIFGRTVLVLLAGLLVSNFVGLALYVSDRANTIARTRGEAVAERIAAIVQSVDEAPRDERATRIAFMRGPGLRVRWRANDPAVAKSQDGWRAGLLKSALESQLEDLEVKEIRVALGSSNDLRNILNWPGDHVRRRHGPPGDRPFRRDRGPSISGDPVGPATPGMMGPGGMGPGMMGAPFDPDSPSLDYLNAAVVVSIQLRDDSWLDCATFFVAGRPFWTSVNFISIVFSAVVVMALALWAVWRATQPLGLFTEAAQRLGRDVNTPDLPEDGPVEVRRAAHAFNVMQARLRAFVNDRTQMLAAISHDLRTPITRLKLRAEFIDDEETQRKTLADLEEMESMIAATLAFARDDSAAEKRTSVDLAAMLQSLCDDALDAGSDAAYQGPDHCAFLGGPIGLKRLFSNVIENALKYGKRAGVTLIVSASDVVIRVEDEGPGIPEDEREKVFRPFHRVERSRSRDTGGVGLGLSVARSVARAHGGEVTLTNRPEGGLRVEVHLPR